MSSPTTSSPPMTASEHIAELEAQILDLHHELGDLQAQHQEAMQDVHARIFDLRQEIQKIEDEQREN